MWLFGPHRSLIDSSDTSSNEPNQIGKQQSSLDTYNTNRFSLVLTGSTSLLDSSAPHNLCPMQCGKCGDRGGGWACNESYFHEGGLSLCPITDLQLMFAFFTNYNRNLSLTLTILSEQFVCRSLMSVWHMITHWPSASGYFRLMSLTFLWIQQKRRLCL